MAYEPALKAFLWFRVSFTGSDVWYPEACRWLRLEHHVYPVEWKNLIERMNQSLKDRLENFDDLFPCFRDECDRKRVSNWVKQP